MRTVLSRPHLQVQAKKAGFVHRSSKLTGALFFDMLLYCSSLQEGVSLSRMAIFIEEHFGIPISKQSLFERFNASCVEFVKAVLKEILEEKFAAIPLYQGSFWDSFHHVRIKDSTKFKIPDMLQEHYKGNGGSLAGISIQYEFDLKTGKVLDLTIYSGDRNDRSDAGATQLNVEEGDLIICDLGYYSLDVFQTFIDKHSYFLSRYYTRTSVFYKDGSRICFQKLYADMKKKGMRQQEIEVYLGNEHRLPVRMLLIPVCDQVYEKRVRDRKKAQKKRGGQMSAEMCACYHFTIFITNVPGESLPAEMIYPVYKLRWQIELMFKQWKSLFCIHKTGKMKEERYLCLLYAKLILIVINLQITYRIQKVIGITGTDGKIRLLSFNKALHTLIRYFNRLYCIIRAQKRMAREALVSLFEILSKNHFLERKKNKEGFCKLIELFLCVSV
ncbi:MAG: IS4 family transposase [Candidatus Symbiothrix sp.]|nr:IS4 family transposase [Candidatus Symbiothrix sp.]